MNSMLTLRRIVGPNPPSKSLCLVTVAKNEGYFWPYFAEHYRKLGVQHFIVLDDHSADGSLDWLATQPDVTVYHANLRFQDQLGRLRMGVAARGLMAKRFCPSRWAIIADLDEFWMPPPDYADFSSLITTLELENHLLCRGLMLDCFPRSFEHLKTYNARTPPGVAAPYCDDIGPVNWPAESTTPTFAHQFNVRNRLVQQLAGMKLMSQQQVIDRGSPTLHKVPLVKWVDGVHMLSAHRLQATYNGDHQILCAHYKFYPGWLEKVKEALETGAYYNQSIEYQMLRLASQHLHDVELRGPTSTSPQRLMQNEALCF